MPQQLTALVELNNTSRALGIGAESLALIERELPEVHFGYLSSHEQLLERIGEPHFVFCWRFATDYYERALNLRAVLTPAAGRDWVADDPRGKVRVHHGSFHGHMIAESMLAMMMHFNDRRGEMSRRQAHREWARDVQMPRSLLANQRVLLVGYGNIGKHCARVLSGIGATVVGLTRRPQAALDCSTGVHIRQFGDLKAELALADQVVLLLPGGDQTYHLFGAEQLSSMKPSAYLYNFGRGTVIDEAELVTALRSRAIAGAGLDVFEQEPLAADSPLWTLDNLLITPHSSCHYREYGPLFASEALPVMRELARG